MPGSPTTAHDLAMAAPGLVDRCVEHRHLRPAPYETAQPPGSGGLEPSSRLASGDYLEDINGSVETLHGHSAEWPDLHEALGQAQGLSRDADGARRGELLHPCGQVRRLADRRVIHAEVAANRAHHHRTGVEPDANLDLDSLLAPNLFCVATNGRLHGEGRRNKPAPRGPRARGVRRTAP
jgi:hypothetical protein